MTDDKHGDAQLPDREKLYPLIAREIACEADCQKWPNGCGCAQNAADRVIAALAPGNGAVEADAWQWRHKEAHQGAPWSNWKHVAEPIEDFKKLFASQMVGDPSKSVCEIRPLYAAPPPAGLDPVTVEACAKFVEQNQETIRETSKGSERYLAPRKVGNLMGIAYVDGIRALTSPQTSGVSKNLEDDALYQLLASGIASPEDQQWTANWLRELHGMKRTEFGSPVTSQE